MTIPIKVLSFPEDSLTILREGEMLSKKIGDEKSQSLFYNTLGSYYSFKGDPLSGMRYTEESFREAEKIQDIELMVPAAVSLYDSYYFTGYFYKITETAPNLINLLEKSNRKSERFFVAMNPYSHFCSQGQT